MTIFVMLSLSNKSLVSVFLIYAPPLILSITLHLAPSFFYLFRHFLSFTIMVHFISLIICRNHPLRTFLPHPLLPAEFPKAPFSAQFFSIFIPLLLALSSVLLLSLTSYMLMIHNSSYPLFLKFLVCINNHQSTITIISSWMSSNYLTLNPSKTEFLLIGRPQQSSKTVNPSLSLPAT